jgi:hypothetical protein
MTRTSIRSIRPSSRGSHCVASTTPRRGLAVVELAILLPILMTVCFGTLEVCNRLFLRQTAAVAAYEGARLAARRTVTQSQVEARCIALLQGRRIVGGQVVITPSGNALATLPTSGQLTVQITIPIAGNTPVSYVLSPSGSVTATAVMLRE